MHDLGVSNTNVFEDWLEEEKAYLLGLQKEPLEETLQMEYWQKLLYLQGSECVPQNCIPVAKYNFYLPETASRL